MPGFWNLIDKLTFGQVSYVESLVMERDLRVPLPEPPQADEFEWRLATPDDFQQDNEPLRLNSGRRRYAVELLESGATCHIATFNGEMVYLMWCVTGRLKVGAYDLPLGDGWVDMNRARTADAFRRRGLHQNGIKRACEHSLDQGCRRTIALIDVDNEASLRNSLRMGTQVVGKVWRVKLFNRWRIRHVPRSLRDRLANPA